MPAPSTKPFWPYWKAEQRLASARGIPAGILERITQALKAHAPCFKAPALKKIAVVMLYHVRAMMARTVDPEAVNAPGAGEEWRTSVRAYLTARLGKS
jgi:hypothetical protein